MADSHDPKDPVLHLENFLPYRLNILAEAVSRGLSEIYSQRFGIAIPEWRVVATLGQFGRMTAKDIGNHSQMHKTKVSRAVASLEKAGFVQREINQEDMRESFLTLTERGSAMYKDLVPEAMSFSRTLADALSKEQQAQLDDILSRLQKAASGS